MFKCLTPETLRYYMRWLVALFYISAGILHLTVPEPFLAITPDWAPRPNSIIALTGLWEIAGALGILYPKTAIFSGKMLALYAIIVFPANINHALLEHAITPLQLGWWYHGPRLAIQPVLVWWPLYCSRATNWPWSGTGGSRSFSC